VNGERLVTAAELGEYLGLSTVRFRLSEVESVLESWRPGPERATLTRAESS
jgi:hypothetical protein